MANKDREQLSVPVDAELKAALERAARAEHRTVASLVRHLVATALENQQVAA
jgi:CopG-like RHH_1 or ribbon-helix-helix domain, RHH_5